jgi:hypothetical protein
MEVHGREWQPAIVTWVHIVCLNGLKETMTCPVGIGDIQAKASSEDLNYKEC